MRPCLPRLLTLLLLLAFGGAACAQAFSSLEERMSEREFTSAGLNKLSPEELQFLNEWLAQRGLAPPVAAAQTPPAGQPAQDLTGLSVGGDRVESRIRGSFRGWSGRTRFLLQNGQVWEQTDDSQLSVPAMDAPMVVITRGVFGAWYLRVEGYNKRARVRRVE